MKRRDFVQNAAPAALLGSLSPKIVQAAQFPLGSFSKDQFGHFYFQSAKTGEEDPVLSPGVFYDACGENIKYEYAPQAFLYPNKTNPSSPFVILCESEGSPEDAFFVTEKDTLQVNLLKGTKFGIFVWDQPDLQFHLKCILSEKSYFSDALGNESGIDFSGTSCVALFSGLVSGDDVTLLVHQEENEKITFLSWNTQQKCWVKFYGENPLGNVIKLDGNVSIKSYAPEVFPTVQNNLVVSRPEAGLFVLNFTCHEKYCVHFEMVGALQDGEILSEQWTYQAPSNPSPNINLFDQKIVPSDLFLEVIWQDGAPEFLFLTAAAQLRTVRWVSQGKNIKPQAYRSYPTPLSWNTQLYLLEADDGISSQLPVCFEPGRGFYALISDADVPVWTAKDLDQINEALQMGERHSPELGAKSPGMLYQTAIFSGLSRKTGGNDSDNAKYEISVGQLQEGSMKPQTRLQFHITERGHVSVTEGEDPRPTLTMGKKDGDGGKDEAPKTIPGVVAAQKGRSFFDQFDVSQKMGSPGFWNLLDVIQQNVLSMKYILDIYLDALVWTNFLQLFYQLGCTDPDAAPNSVLTIGELPRFLKDIHPRVLRDNARRIRGVFGNVAKLPKIILTNVPEVISAISYFQSRRLAALTLCFKCENIPLDTFHEVFAFSGHSFVSAEPLVIPRFTGSDESEGITRRALSAATDILCEVLDSSLPYVQKFDILENFAKSVLHCGYQVAAGAIQDVFLKRCLEHLNIAQGCSQGLQGYAGQWTIFCHQEISFGKRYGHENSYPCDIWILSTVSPGVKAFLTWKLFYLRICHHLGQFTTTEQKKFSALEKLLGGVVPAEALDYAGISMEQKMVGLQTRGVCYANYRLGGSDLFPLQENLGQLPREFWASMM